MNKKLVEHIYNFILEHPSCSFAELETHIEGFKGNLQFGIQDSCLVLWTEMSKEAIDAISELISNSRIDLREVSPLAYWIDSERQMPFPVAKKSKVYRTPHWVPLLFSAA